MDGKRIAILLSLIFVFLFIIANDASASSGALRKASIKQCPNGKYYGQHSSDNHWHEAERSNTSSGWSAIGPELSGDPCPAGTNQATPAPAETAPAAPQQTQNEPQQEQHSTPQPAPSTATMPQDQSQSQSQSQNQNQTPSTAQNQQSESPKLDEEDEAAPETEKQDDIIGVADNTTHDSLDSSMDSAENTDKDDDSLSNGIISFMLGVYGTAGVAGGAYAVYKTNKKK